MSKKLILAPCMIILAVFLASSMANAESAWVLWKKAELMEMALKKTTIWEIVNAYPDHAQCMQAKE